MLQQLGESIWAHEQRVRFGGLALWHRMTVISLARGGLVIHSPTVVDAELRDEIFHLGPVVAIIAPSWWHDMYLRESLRTFPEAKLYGAATLVKWNPSLPFTDTLSDSSPLLWNNEMLQRHITGIGLFLDEVVFYHKQSRSLIVADLLFNISRSDAWLTRTLARVVIGPYPGCRFARLYRPFVFDGPRFRAAIELILEWDIDQIIVGHGAVVQKGGKDVLREAFRSILK
jgi:hypothetical protein